MIRRGSVNYRRAIRSGWRPLSNGRWLPPVDVPPRIVPYDEALRFADIQMAIERV